MKPQAVGAIIFTLTGLALIIGGGGYMYWKLKPVDPKVQAREQLRMARANVNAGDYALAIEYFSQALDLDPELNQAFRQRGETHYLIGGYFEAIRDLTTAIDRGIDDAETHLLRGKAYRAAELFDDALADYATVDRLEPGNREVLRESGSLLLELGRYEEAAAHLEKAIARVPSDGDAQRNLAWALWGLGRYAEAIPHFDRAIEEDPFNYNGPFGRGMTHAFLGDYRAAIADFELAVAPEDSNADYAHFLLFLTRLRIGESDQAFETLRAHRVEHVDPRHGDDWTGIITQFLLGDLTEAAFLEHVEETGTIPDPERVVEGCFYAGFMRLLNDDREGAIELFRRSAETKVYRFYEYHASVAELRRMGVMVGPAD